MATQMFKSDRENPQHLWQLSDSAIRRWRSTVGKPYRPDSLDRVRSELERLGPWTFTEPTELIATEIVKRGDTLGLYARRHYDDGKLWTHIHAANEDVVSDPDDMDRATALAWLSRQDLASGSLPAVVVREIASLLP